MKYTFFLLALLVFIQFNHAQNFKEVDNIIKKYPKKFNSTDALAARIIDDFDTNLERVRAIYAWLALNVHYDFFKDDLDIANRTILYTSSYDRKYALERRRLNKVQKLLKTNKGVCLDFSYAFYELCRHLDIEATFIVGYSKTTFTDIGNQKNVKDHSWNAVYIDDQWHLIDVTWGALSSTTKIIDSYYFLAEPAIFISSHLPLDTAWQLLDDRVSKATFFEAPLLFPNYFEEGYELVNSELGLLSKKDKELEILFEKIPKKAVLYYGFNNEQYMKPLRIKSRKDRTYYASIRHRKKTPSELIIYSNSRPIIGYKIK